MPKVAIVTTYRSFNYGSVLQAYALQATVKSLGYHCEHLKCHHKTQIRRSLSHLDSVIKLPSRIARRLFRTGLYRKGCKFRAFVSQYINENPRLYESLDDLKSTNNIYDAFICGSDQIWSPVLFAECYYLNFVNENRKKIAYAPSIGLPVIPDHLKPRMAHLIRQIPHVSVREKQGAALINELTGINVPIVLDPTLLVTRNDWEAMAVEPTIDKPYILCYFLGDNPKHRQAVDRYKSTTGGTLVVLPKYKQDYSWGDIILDSIGPLEFLGLVKNAHRVFTDSYHGILFSVNLNISFNAFMRFTDDHALCQNSRVENILELLGLQHRLVGDGLRDIIDQDGIDYQAVNKIVDHERRFSIDYLRSSLMESANQSPTPCHADD